MSGQRMIPVPSPEAEVSVHWHLSDELFDRWVGHAEVHRLSNDEGPFRTAKIEVDGQPVRIYGRGPDRHPAVTVAVQT